MDNSQIKDLLNRFYAGETSLEEEIVLKQYFASDESTYEMDSDKELFAILSDNFDEVEVPESLDGDLANMIERLASQDRQGRRVKISFRYAAAAVAILAICLVAFLPHRLPQDTYTANVEMSEEEAMAKFQESMALVSKGFEKSYDAVYLADETLGNSIKTIVDAMK